MRALGDRLVSPAVEGLVQDRPGPAPLSLAEKISYGFGDFAYSLPWNLAGAFLLYFYTDVALLPASSVATLFLLARLFDAAVDLGVGILVDKTRSRWGRARPYFLFGALPFGALIVLTFVVPDIGPLGRLAYAYVSFNLLGILFSLGAVPYSALLPMMTRDPGQRLQLGSWRSIGTSCSVIVATAATMPLVAWLGAGDMKRGFALISILFAIMSVVLIGNLFQRCRERHHDAAPADFAVMPAIGAMLRNRAWLVTFVFTVLNFVRFGAVLSVTPYFAINVLGRPWMISVLMPAVSGMLLVGAAIAPPVLRRTGIRAGCIGALVPALVLYLALPFAEQAPAAFIATFLSASVLISITMTAIFTMAAEAVEVHEALNGIRNEGLLAAGITLSTKIGMAIGAVAIGYTLALSGYQANAFTPAAGAAIRWSYYGWPMLVLPLQMACIAFWRGAPIDHRPMTAPTR